MMRDSIRAEAIRLLASPSTPRFLWAGVAAALFLTGGLVLLGPEHMNPPMPGPGTAGGIRGLLGLLVLTAPIPVLLGSRAMTSEFEHRTIVPTLLFQPHRARVVGAKLVVMALAGAGYGLAVAAAATAGLIGGCRIARITPGLPVTDVAASALRIGLSMACYTVIGVGIGALVARPQQALAVIVGWFYLAESLLSAIPGIQRLYPWLPGGAASAVTGQNFVLDAINTTTGGAPVQLLAPVAGIAVLLAYAAGAAALAWGTTLRHDVH